ncbi:MAG: hypothetical protein Q4A49_03090 [Neisseria sp.]|nr:hypothetical protein [Neisseria sp.]
MLLSLLLALPLAAQAVQSDAERIAELERKVARLTEQVNLLLAERRPAERSGQQEAHVCSLRAFTATYRAEGTNLGRTKLDVLKQCGRENHQMHCRERDIRCETYR